MTKYLLILLTFFALALESPAAPKKVVPKPVTAEEVVKSGGTVRNAQQDAELREWIIGIQKLAQDAQADADKAQKEAEASRAENAKAQQGLSDAGAALVEANVRADGLQKTIDAQTEQLNKTLKANVQLKEDNGKLTKHISHLTTILALEAAAVALLAMLWLRVPSMGPWGLIATIGGPVVVFTAAKFLF